jgi:hypothetical protein
MRTSLYVVTGNGSPYGLEIVVVSGIAFYFIFHVKDYFSLFYKQIL